MNDEAIQVRGGCLCGALRYVAEGLPLFAPRIALFDRDRPAWAPLPPGIAVCTTMPGH